MRHQLSVFILVGVIAGLVGAWTWGQLHQEAGAAPPPPSPTQVREQNLDGSGFIRTHEQGTANVNATNLPLDGSGNVRVSPAIAAPTGRVTLVAENITLAPGESYTTGYLDTADCHHIAGFSTTDYPFLIGAALIPSVDGVTAAGRVFATGGSYQGAAGVTGSAYYFQDGSQSAIAPKVAITFTDNHTSVAVTISKAWLFCSS